MSNEITTAHARDDSRLDFDNFWNVIDGKLISTAQSHQTTNPSTLEPNPKVPLSTQQDVDNCVTAAKAALGVWATTPLAQRRLAAQRFADGLAAHATEFAKMLVKEQGKPLYAATEEVKDAIQVFQVAATLPFEENLIQETETRRVVLRHVPVGVCVGIVPWNFPLSSISYKLAPSLIAGCPMIIKPSPFTPYCGLKLAELSQQFFPPGVVQALAGDGNLGPWLTAHPGVNKVSFTGSVQTGKKVMESCSKSLKRVTLELGGNDPAIICSDIDIPSVATAITGAALYNCGQVCVATKRVYVHASIFDDFVAAMAAVAKSLKIGDGFSSGVFNGPLQNSVQLEMVKALQAAIKEEGLEVITCDQSPVPQNGLFLTPIIVVNPPDDASIVIKEQFGPIIPVLKWTDEDEAIHRANDSSMGLGASVWSRDLAQAERIGRRVEAGNVWINTQVGLQPDAPFSGHKESGIGAELGVEGIKSFCNVQTLHLKPSIN